MGELIIGDSLETGLGRGPDAIVASGLAQIGDSTFVYAADINGGTFFGWSVAPDGTLTEIFEIFAVEASSVSHVRVGGSDYLLTGSRIP